VKLEIPKPTICVHTRNMFTLVNKYNIENHLFFDCSQTKKNHLLVDLHWYLYMYYSAYELHLNFKA